MGSTVLIVLGVFLAVIILMLVFSNIRIVPQARAGSTRQPGMQVFISRFRSSNVLSKAFR